MFAVRKRGKCKEFEMLAHPKPFRPKYDLPSTNRKRLGNAKFGKRKNENQTTTLHLQKKTMKIDINCDMGESFGHFRIGRDEDIMPYITSCNIACGFHGGDPLTIENSLKLAKKFGVKVGAHPSYPDLAGFGRRPMHIPAHELHALIAYQVSALKGMAESLNLRLHHVKPHGALYHAATQDEAIARTLLEAIRSIDPQLAVYGPANIGWHHLAEKMGIRYVHEAFADRHYRENGSLLPRSHPLALLYEPDKIARRALKLLQQGSLTTLSGKEIKIKAQTLCLHSDHPQAPQIAKKLHDTLRPFLYSP